MQGCIRSIDFCNYYGHFGEQIRLQNVWTIDKKRSKSRLWGCLGGFSGRSWGSGAARRGVKVARKDCRETLRSDLRRERSKVRFAPRLPVEMKVRASQIQNYGHFLLLKQKCSDLAEIASRRIPNQPEIIQKRSEISSGFWFGVVPRPRAPCKDY